MNFERKTLPQDKANTTHTHSNMATIRQTASNTFEIEPSADFRAKGWTPAVIHATSKEQAIKHYKTTHRPR